MSSRRNASPVRAPGRAPTSAQKRLAAQRAAAARARIEQAHRRRQWLVAGTAALVIVAIVAALVVAKVVVGGGSKSGATATPAAPAVVRAVSSVPSSVLDSVGTGAGVSPPAALSATALTENGKPELLYIGAEYCPYCAAERWAVAVALSRFGTLHGLGQTSSSSSDIYPNTPTLSFHGATYTSSVLAFTGREIESNKLVGGQYTPLDKLTAEQQSLYTKYDTPPYVESSGIPFIYFGGRYVIAGASYNPSLLHGKTHAQVAAALSQPSSAIARAIDGTANYITAAICSMTDQRPGAVCSSSGVRAAAAKLPTAGSAPTG